jgi:pSer/pThr/pTyr-binding forkhead associated (FHA) protein
MSAELRLIVTQGPNSGSEYVLEDDETTIGRSANNSIVLPSPEISRRHAHLWLDGDAILLEDLGSTNGTFVNNARLYKQVPLFDGDEIQLGDSYRLVFSSPDGAERPFTTTPNVESSESMPAGSPVESDDSSPSSESPLPETSPETTGDEKGFSLIMPEISSRQQSTILQLAVVVALLLVLWLLTFLFLDSFDQGRLLYCGNLQPFFRLFLGPFGFNPVCP